MQSPQGATILLYAHENGVSIVWRGGRRLKAPKGSEKRNGTSSSVGPEDAIMIVDSDDEVAPSSGAFVDRPEFEEASAPIPSSCPEITQTLDLALGSAALHLGVLPMSPCAAADAAWHGADILRERIVFAVTLVTNDILVVTLPLTPPSHESKARPELRKGLLEGNAGKGIWNETITLLTGQGRQSDSLAMSIIKPKPASDRSRSLERTNPPKPSFARVVVAASSKEANGTLRFWDVALDAKPGATVKKLEPFQVEYMPSPLSTIAFNPSHTTQLLAVASPHAVRVYDYSIPSLPSDDTSEGPFPTQGSWLLSLYQPFARSSTTSIARKPIVGAEWISHGRAVLTLLADGQWGIWDIDGASPASNSQPSLFGKHGSGLRGSATTIFSATGYLEGTSPLRNPNSQKSTPASAQGAEFVPMTPHSRLLSTSMAGGPERLATVQGGISVTKLPTTRGSGSTLALDESAILWLGGADPIVAVIPVISRFWDAQLRRGVGGGVNLFSGAQPTRMIRLTDLGAGLLGERCVGAAAVARFGQARPVDNGGSESTPKGDSGSRNSVEGLPIEIVLQAESRLVIVLENEDGTPLTNRLISSRTKKSRNSDRHASAIIAYPRPEKPSSVAFNLSVSRRGFRSHAQRAPLSGLFEAPTNENFASTEQDDDGATPRAGSRFKPHQPKVRGLAFMQDLEHAADQPDDFEAENRDVEQEMMDIMEIDRELEQMENDREQGTKHVFFEG